MVERKMTKEERDLDAHTNALFAEETLAKGTANGPVNMNLDGSENEK